MHTFSRQECQRLWFIGVMERLASLGLIEQIPMRLDNSALDIFLELDSENVRYNLFDNDKEVLALLDATVKYEFPATPNETVAGIGDMLLEYKNNRYKLVRYCLEQQYSQSVI